jgi:hypothetical protein
MSAITIPSPECSCAHEFAELDREVLALMRPPFWKALPVHSHQIGVVEL